MDKHIDIDIEIGYNLVLKRAVEKALIRMDTRSRLYVRQKLDELAMCPRGQGCTKLSGLQSAYRKVAWPYRILYRVDDAERRVYVYRIGHRKDVYR
jgi:mRNA interferase RelE/StbE